MAAIDGPQILGTGTSHRRGGFSPNRGMVSPRGSTTTQQQSVNTYETKINNNYTHNNIAHDDSQSKSTYKASAKASVRQSKEFVLRESINSRVREKNQD